MIQLHLTTSFSLIGQQNTNHPMNLKFNNGNGALICDQCRVVIDSNFRDFEWRALLNLSEVEGDWFCKDCCSTSYKEQSQKFVDEVNRIAHEFSRYVPVMFETGESDGVLD